MSGGGFKFTPDPAAIKKLATGKDVLDFIDGHAERCLATALQIAPVKTGEYKDSLSVSPARETGTGDVEAELRSSSWHWHFVEFGTLNNPAQHVLERAITQSGLKFKPGG